jgi:leucyl-tRNA synthetase
MIASDAEKDDVIAIAKSDAKIADFIVGKDIVKEIYVPKKLVNIVVK